MSYMQLSQKFYDAFKLCGSPPIARKLHAQLILSGLDASLFLLNNLLHVYSNCGMVDDAFRVFREANHANIFTWNTMLHAFFDSGRMREAENLFDEMPHIVRDSVSWTTMISGYCQNGLPAHSIKTFMSMLRDSNHDIQNCDPFSYTCTMKACGCLASTRFALQLHAHVIKLHLGAQTCIQNSLVDMYIKCGAITLSPPISYNCQGGITFLTIFAHNPRIIVWVGSEKMFRIVVAINDDFTQCIVNMYILASLTYKMFQELCEQTKPIPAYQKATG